MDRVGFWVLTDVWLVGQGTRKSKVDYWRQGGLGEKMDLWEWSQVDASVPHVIPTAEGSLNNKVDGQMSKLLPLTTPRLCNGLMRMELPRWQRC